MSSAIGDLAIRASSHAAVGYFVDEKKGEVNELKALLKNINVEKDVRRKREIIKKVIAYMTLGIDVSRLFTDMIMAVESKDIVVKKMVYLYLCNYAHAQPELAIMCINSLRRECENEDPTVRGLALRSLCSLRLESILEYIEQPLQRSFTDISSYVRKTGVMGVLKLNKLSPQLVQQHGYVDMCHSMLQDQDATVVVNALYVLNELQIESGGLTVSAGTVMALLTRIGEFTEWGLNTILGLIARYTPSSEDECYAIMNLLDPLLRTANSGVVLATFKCFLSLTEGMPDMHTQIYERAKAPMLTLVTGAHGESQFCMLKHLEIMLRKPAAQGVFDDEFRQFFVRYNEAPHVKHLKVDLLPLISNNANARDIAAELAEYVTDVDAELSRRAIRSIGEIAMRLESVSEEMTLALLQLIDMDAAYVRSEAASVLVNVIRIAPAATPMVLPFLSRMLKRVDDPAARAALLWTLGEYGEHLVEAPYLLESAINNYEETFTGVKLQLLTASMKLFFKRPPEVHRMLGRLFSMALNETSSQDLHDRALLYYRLLNTDLPACEAMFAPQSARLIGGEFAENLPSERVNGLFREFNSLAVIYGMPSKQFVGKAYQFKTEEAPEVDFDVLTPDVLVPTPSAPINVGQGSAVEDVGGMGMGGMDLGMEIRLEATSPSPSPAPSPSPTPESTFAPISTPTPAPAYVDLLDMDEPGNPPGNPGPGNMGTNMGTGNMGMSPGTMGLQMLSSTGRFSPPTFQKLWGRLGEAYAGRVCVLQRAVGSPAEAETALRSQKITVMASGPLPPGPVSGIKLFAYGLCTLPTSPQEVTFLLQLTAIRETGEVTATIKTDALETGAVGAGAAGGVGGVGGGVELFLAALRTALATFQPW